MPNPTKFTIRFNSVMDEDKLASVEKIHLLSYKLCHTYFNIPSAIRTVAPI